MSTVLPGPLEHPLGWLCSCRGGTSPSMSTSRRMQGSQAQPHGVPPESSTGLSPGGASLGEHRVSAEPPPRPLAATGAWPQGGAWGSHWWWMARLQKAELWGLWFPPCPEPDPELKLSIAGGMPRGWGELTCGRKAAQAQYSLSRCRGEAATPVSPRAQYLWGSLWFFTQNGSSSVNNAFPASLQRGRAAGLVLAHGL